MNATSPIAEAIQKGDVHQVRTLLQSQPVLIREAHGAAGEPLLLLAVAQGQPEIVEALLDQGADIDQRNGDGSTALHLAAQQGQEALIKLLLEHMADINATTNDGQTPMELAIKSGHDAAKWFTL